MPGFTDAGQWAVKMSKVVELHGSAASAFDYPLLQVVGRVFVVVQDVPRMTDQNSNSSCSAPPRLQLNGLVVVALSETCTIMSKRLGRGELSSHCEELRIILLEKKHTSVLITPSNDSGKITVPGSPSEPRIHLTVKEVEWQDICCCTKFSASRKKRGMTTINTQNSTGRRIVYINKETSTHKKISLYTPYYCGGWLQGFQVRVVDNL